jgi:glutathione S-transferase
MREAQTRNLEIPGSLTSFAPRNDVSVIVFEGILDMYHYTALVTCLAISFYFFTAVQVARARGAFGVKAPATIGNLDFERVFRVQANTLEWMPIFLPSLWLFAIYINDPAAAVLGLIWIVGRILYLTGYSKAAGNRGRGFGIQASAAVLLWAGALGAIVWRLVHG